MNRTESTTLLKSAKAGSHEALNDLLGRYAGRLLALIRLRMGRSLRAHAESQDLLQACLLKAFQHIDRFEGGDTDSLMAWLARIAENEIRDQAAYHGRQRRDVAREVVLEPGLEAVADQVCSLLSRMVVDEETARLEQALKTLDEHHREIILLRKFEELSFSEISVRLGKSPDACRMLLSRAMTALTLKTCEPQ